MTAKPDDRKPYLGEALSTTESPTAGRPSMDNTSPLRLRP
jgi:hypothetical protein